MLVDPPDSHNLQADRKPQPAPSLQHHPGKLDQAGGGDYGLVPVELDASPVPKCDHD